MVGESGPTLRHAHGIIICGRGRREEALRHSTEYVG